MYILSIHLSIDIDRYILNTQDIFWTRKSCESIICDASWNKNLDPTRAIVDDIKCLQLVVKGIVSFLHLKPYIPANQLGTT